MHRTLPLLAALFALAGVSTADARPVAGGARTSVNRSASVNRGASVNRSYSGNVNRNYSTNVNRNYNGNVNVHRDLDVDVDRNYGGYGYGYNYGYHPVARGAAVAGAAVATAAAVGTVVATLPTSCVATNVGGVVYQQCGSTWYQPRYAGTSVQYVVVNPP